MSPERAAAPPTWEYRQCHTRPSWCNGGADAEQCALTKLALERPPASDELLREVEQRAALTDFLDPIAIREATATCTSGGSYERRPPHARTLSGPSGAFSWWGAGDVSTCASGSCATTCITLTPV